MESYLVIFVKLWRVLQRFRRHEDVVEEPEADVDALFGATFYPANL